MAKRTTKAAADKAAVKTDVTITEGVTATDNAPKAAVKPDVAVAEDVTVTENAPETVLDTNTGGSANANDADGNKAGTADAETVQKAQEEAAEGMATMKAVTRYLDKQLNEIKDAGETYTVSIERAAELVRAKVAEIIK